MAEMSLLEARTHLERWKANSGRCPGCSLYAFNLSRIEELRGDLGAARDILEKTGPPKCRLH